MGSVFQETIQNKLMPFANKIQSQKHLQSIKDGMMGIASITVVGSFCLIPLAIKNLLGTGPIADFIGAHTKGLTYINTFTTGLISLYTAIFIANSLCKKYNINSIITPVMAVIFHLILCCTTIEGGLSTAYLGSQGMFVAIISAIITVEITRFMVQKKLVIKLPSSVPPMVSESFSSLIPMFVVLIIATIITMICLSTTGTILPELVMKALAPAMSSMDTLTAMLIIIFLTQFFWFLGLHGPGITSAIWVPFAVTYTTANIDAYAAGQPVTHFFTFGFYYALLQVTGSGLTLGLVILMMRSKAKSLSSIGKAAIIPSIFGINEPVIFGAPIILNPYMFIPFVFGPLVVTVICYLSMSLKIVGMPIASPPGFLPPGVGAFLMTLDWKSVVLVFICLAFMTLVYYPFFKAMEKDEIKKESK